MKRLTLLVVSVLFLSLQGCAGFFASSGTSRSAVEATADPQITDSPVTLIPVNNGVALRVLTAQRSIQFREVLAPAKAPENIIGAGDAIDILIWEAPPAILFASAPPTSMISTAALSGGKSSQFVPSPATLGMPMTALPPQVVSQQGSVVFPFIGRITVGGKTLAQIESLIVEKLAGKANQPQVMVRLVNNAASTATVVGEVVNSALVPLTPRGERLLDAIALAGGVRQPVNKTTILISRKGQTQALPLETIIQNPQQNIHLLPGDVITAYYQPLSMTVLGSTGKNDEVTFEAQGIMLSQALARVGGLVNSLSDAKGVFIFRFEDTAALDEANLARANKTQDGKVPVIYQFDMSDPATFFASQNFPIKNKDMVYVASASSVELMKFLAIVTSVLSPAAAINSGVLSGVKF